MNKVKRKPAAWYREVFTWLIETENIEPTQGEHVPTWTSHANLFGYVQQLGSSEILAYGMRQSEATCKVFVQGLPSLNPKDRLYLDAFDETYLIDGIARQDTELIVFAHLLNRNANEV